ncbi:uncharacterized protein EV422DRAFT_401876 [Fimicolochytrium jonesii]|uniref:uncharacterized protein n=1 Tax=Fimicolochytrium jonesii TaxID=1396493 RepID=UPI0022FE75FB|nr:uncharacterized protein EV422DRAFT_401876 [Fimicolochytrium jonesii]KAI8822507.1 hypothetical protein EV422DRAFT_401876 [Fimicolochytrium jonesii]
MLAGPGPAYGVDPTKSKTKSSYKTFQYTEETAKTFEAATDEDDNPFMTPGGKDSGGKTMIYASSTKKQRFTGNRIPNVPIGEGGRHTPFRRVASYSPDRSQSHGASNGRPRIPFAGFEEDEDENSETSLVDDDFRRMVEALGKEELTMLEGVRMRHAGRVSEVANEREDAGSFSEVEEQAADNDQPLQNNESQFEDDYDIHSIDAPEVMQLDEEFDEFTNSMREDIEQIPNSALEQLPDPGDTSLDVNDELHFDDNMQSHRLSGSIDARGMANAEESSMREFWQYATARTSPTMRRKRHSGATSPHVQSISEQELDDVPFQHTSAPKAPDDRASSPESSLGVLSEPGSPVHQHRSPPPESLPGSPVSLHRESHVRGANPSPVMRLLPNVEVADEADELPSFDGHSREFDEPLSPASQGPMAKLDGMRTSRQQPLSASHDIPRIENMLADARNEIRTLRALNERLVQDNQELKADLDAAFHEKDRVATDMEQQHRDELRKREEEDEARYASMREAIAAGEEQLRRSRAEQEQIGSIRNSLREEKELDILNIKKELTSQKERELLELRQAMAADKEEVMRKNKDEMRRQAKEFAEERNYFEEERSRARNLIKEREKEIRDLEEQVYQKSKRPQSDEFGQQYDAYSQEIDRLHRELAAQKTEHEATRQVLEEQIRRERRRANDLQHKLASQAPATDRPLSDILASYPNQLEQFRNSLAAEHSERLADCESAHAASLREMQARHDAAVADLQQRIEQDQARMLEKQKQQILDITAKLKERCANAYETAVQKLKEERARAEHDMNARHTRHREQWAAEVKKLRSEREALRKRVDADDNARAAEVAHSRIAELEHQIRSLKDALARTTLDHNKALLDEKAQHEKEMQERLRKMKQQYISTLTMMRDDLKRSREVGLEKFETEWNRKKSALDAAWQKRLDEAVARQERPRVRRSRDVSIPIQAPAAAPVSTQQSSHGLPTSSAPSRRPAGGADMAPRRTGDTTLKVAWKPPG